MKRKILALGLTFVLLLNLLSVNVFAAEAITLTSNVSESVCAGDSFTVTIQVPAITTPLGTAAIKLTFNKEIFELTAIMGEKLPIISGGTDSNSSMSPNVEGANTNGWISWGDTTTLLTNELDCSAGRTITATFKVKAGVAAGTYDFALDSVGTKFQTFDKYGDVATETSAHVTLPAALSITVVSAISGTQNITGVTAPAKGTAPVTSVTAPTGVLANIEWYKEGESTALSGNFAANTVYQAKITVKPGAGYQFANGIDFTVDGDKTGLTSKKQADGSYVLTKTFPKTESKTLTKLEVTTDPTTKSYTHGDGFDPTGMVVKATYDDGSTDTNFTGYTVEYKTVGKGYLCVGHTGVTLKKDGKTVDVTGLTVNKKELTVTGLTAVEREYKPGDKSVTLTGGTLSGVVGSETVTLNTPYPAATVADDKAENNKEVTIGSNFTISGTDMGNYTLTQPSGIKVNIKPKNISGAVITYGTQNTYNGTEQSVVIDSVKVDGTTLNAGDYTLDPVTSKATDVEEKTLEITGKGNYGGSATASTAWKLQQATPVVGDFNTSGLAASYSYTGSEQNAPVPTTVKTGMGTVTVNYPSGAKPKYVGDYNLTFSVAESQNYKAAGPFTYGTMKIVAVEDPAVITTTASMPKGGYSLDLRTLVSDDAKGDVTFALVPGATSATLSGYTLTSTGIPGTVTINVTIKAKDENGDSKVEYTGKTGTITVNVLNKTTDSSTMKVTQDGCTYGEALPAYVLTGKPTGAGTDTVLYTGTLRNGSTYSSSTAPTEAGSYTVKVECETTTTIYKATSASFTIEPKSISGATVDAITGLTYTGTAHTPAPAVKMNGTALNNATDYTLSYSENTNAGTATMTVTGKGNYIDTKTVNFGIGQATLTITDATIGAKAYDGTKNATVTSVTFSGLQNSETLDMTTDYTVSGVFNSENVNDANTVTVSVTLKGTAKTKNYTLPTATFNKPATITQAATPAAPTGLTGVKGQALSTVSLTAHPGWSWANPSQSMSATGSQTFTANYTDPNGNYALGTGISVVVEVSAKTNVSGSITFADGTLTYNGNAQTYEKATISGVSGGTWNYTYVANSGTGASLDSGKPKTAGTYTVTAKYEDSANLGTKNATLTISKATPTGTPKYTAITTSGKTLADAGLTVTGGTFSVPGTVKWVDDAGADLADTTPVTANTYYKWLFTPTDTANYNTHTGSIKLYAKSSGGGGGSYTPSYTVSVDKTENGTITVSPKSASKGDTVTITVKPDKGYELEMLKALDKDGDALKLTEKNGKYTFKMPSGKVTVKGSFVEEAPVQIFKDVPVDAYYYEAVKWAAEKGITGGVGNGLFAPNQPCTRAQIVTFLWRAAGSPAPKSMSSFADVPADAFYAKAVAWAVENGITGGTGDGKFSPDATCTRAQSVTFLYRAAGSPKVSGSAEFGDVATNAYYADAVAWAAKNGITGGIGGGLFGSDNNCTRAQIVTFLYRNYQSK